MKTVAGVFRHSEAARTGADALTHAGFSQDQVNLFCPGSKPGGIRSVPASETEQPGVGGAFGGVLGGALGLAGGFELGTGVTALIPGVGPVFAVGMAAAVLFGAGGAVAGAMAGKAAENFTTEGVPEDEIFFYEDALRQGRSVVLVLAENDVEKKRARKVLGDAGAESLDAARKEWWLGLRDVEAEHYRALGHNFERDQDTYRSGFEAALRRECRGKTFTDQADRLKWLYPDVWDAEAFKRGFVRGREYWERQSAETASRESR